MTPTHETFRVFWALGLGLGVFLSLSLFILARTLGREIKWRGLFVVVLAGYGLPIIGFASKYVADMKTWQNEAPTVGLVVAHDLPNHNQYQFEYTVSGQKFSTWHQGTVDCGPSEIVVGRSFKLYYDPIDPGKADVCSFKAAVKKDLKILGFLSGLLLFTVLLVAIQHKNKTR